MIDTSAGQELLDGMTAEELERLPFGVIQVDGSGRIVYCNAAARWAAGGSGDVVSGRNFFLEAAPATHVPAFHGRFLDGVRRGRLLSQFDFMFGSDAPRAARVEMFGAQRAGRYWIVLRQLEVLPPTGQRAAAAAARNAVDNRLADVPVSSSVCEREPIHRPGAVQPHALMLALAPADLTLVACSANLGELTGGRVADAMGAKLEALLNEAVAGELREALESGLLADPIRPFRRTGRFGVEHRLFGLAAHISEGLVLIELEMLAERPEDFGAATPLQAQDAFGRLRAADSLAAAAAACAEEIRSMSGFERVLVYRFDPEWNGEAIAESKTPAYESLLGLRFPASDIPAQARALYARSPARFVIDRDAVPSPVLADPRRGNRPIDLSHAASRALSPIHLEYQRNLGVNGSMSVSIVVGGVLWGLVIGHHHRPHYITPDTRALVVLVSDAFALRVHELASAEVTRKQQGTLRVQNMLLERLAGSDDFVTALAPGEPGSTLLDLFHATGAAVVSGRRVVTLGAVPPEEVIAGVATWLRNDVPRSEVVFSSSDLSRVHPPAAAWPTVASGLLAAFVDAERRHLLMWFRPEVASAITWGGDPAKSVLADEETRIVLPRRSFERWVEERRGQAEPWSDWQLRSARALSAAIEGVVLRQGRKIQELSAKQAELSRALELKEVLTREVDHRVKNSLQIVASVMLMQARGVSDPEARAAFEDTYARVMSVARVHDSLQHSPDIESVDLGQTLRQLCDDLGAGVAGAGRRLEIEAEQGLMVSSSAAVALSLIATELVTNALKYAYDPDEPGKVEVSVRARGDSGVELRVCDAGKGLPPDWADGRRRAGGLGMRVVRAMLKQIGAELSVEPDRRPGACFTVAV